MGEPVGRALAGGDAEPLVALQRHRCCAHLVDPRRGRQQARQPPREARDRRRVALYFRGDLGAQVLHEARETELDGAAVDGRPESHALDDAAENEPLSRLPCHVALFTPARAPRSSAAARRTRQAPGPGPPAFPREVRQAKPGKGGSHVELTETLRRNPAGTTPPGKGWPPAGTECCVVRGDRRLRSVHRECAGRVIEPRKAELSWEPTPL